MKHLSLFLFCAGFASVTHAQTQTLQSVTQSLDGNSTDQNIWVGTKVVSGVTANALNVGGRIKFLGALNAFNTGTDATEPTIYRSYTGGSYPFTAANNLVLQAGLSGGHIVFATGNAPLPVMMINNVGNVEIGGGSNPTARLQVDGNLAIGGSGYSFGISMNDKFTYSGISQLHYGMQWVKDPDLVGGFTMYQSGYMGIKFFTQGLPRLTVGFNGNVGIGTTNPQSELSVNGTVTSKKVKVTATGWADFVFAPEYQLPSLKKVEAFIKEHRHLPDVPGAEKVEKEGQDLGEMNKILLQKVEELTLHLIAQQKEIEELKAAIKK
ncbi:hypothetical protein [Chitinophaga sancti]|uniref:hypothetical protein n=1 Tax=Chitinophaga sancti TaxID=1004 RepID=UPI003F78C5C3